MRDELQNKKHISSRGRLTLLGRMRGATFIKIVVLIPVTLVVLLALVFTFYEGRKAYWDYRVKEMCERDGGIKVYDTVTLPVDKFNEWGQPNFYKPDEGDNALGREYIFRSKVSFYRKGNPQVARYRIQVIRRDDGKLLGESVSYGRGGGDIPSPSYGSGFHCPEEYGDVPLLTRIFKPNIKE